MRVELIAVGSELLLGQVVNTNAAYLSQELSKIGIDVFHHSTVGDNPERMQEVFAIACSRADLIMTTGGLGPTADDITNETWAEFFGLEIMEDAQQVKILEEKFHGREIAKINYKQARRPEGTRVIPNKIGTAPGIILEAKCSKNKHDVSVLTFPGVPCEMKEMFQSHAVPYLKNKMQERGEAAAIVSKDIRLSGITESMMAQKINDFFDTDNPSIAPYATLGECRLRITAKAETVHKARNLIQPLQMKVERELGEYIYGYDSDTLPGVVARKLIHHDMSIAFAESCTGGLLSKMMTDTPGSSVYVFNNYVTYSNQSKMQVLNVPEEILRLHGAVSAETAEAMVKGLSKISNSDINLAITGIAGPEGGTEEKPIGTIYVAITYPKNLGDDFATRNPSGKFSEIKLEGESKNLYLTKLDWHARPLDREQVRELAAKKSLNIIRKILV